MCVQVEDVKGELLDRYKVLPALSSRLSELENQNDELREKNRQMEQKLATIQVTILHSAATVYYILVKLLHHATLYKC